MSNQRMIITVCILGLLIFAIKLLPMIFLKNKIKNKFLNSFLAYIPYAVLTSMTFPEVFYHTSSTISAFVGALAAIIMAYFEQSLIVVTLSATIVVLIVEQIMRMVFSF